MLDIIRMPAKTIISSVSKDAELLMSKIEKHKNFNFGFNAKTEKLDLPYNLRWKNAE